MIERSPSDYRLDELGWLQFERLCELIVAAETDDRELDWSGHADRVREATLAGPITLATAGVTTRGPAQLLVVWAPAQDDAEQRIRSVVARAAGRLDDQGSEVVVMTNLDGPAVARALPAPPHSRRVSVLGRAELSVTVDRHASVRSALPSVLGLCELTGLISVPQRGRSSLDVEGATALGRVFWPTRAYERARAVLAAHRFVVLTGPPEMGKTAIARMLALAQMTDGWDAHECTSPEQLWRVFASDRRQVFVADDAFGSTEYRPDAAERWARSLERLLACLDGKHWLIWTSRPAPLKAGLRRVQRERHAERFPAPGQVLVDASDLDLFEKTLILFRHAKARGLSPAARELLRTSALTLVEHPHFTPERIRRLVSDRLDGLEQIASGAGIAAVEAELERALATPTEAMRTSCRALGDEHRDLLVALLDAPAGLIDERELTAAVRRHHPGGLSRPPAELIDRLTDHFLRLTPLGIGWVHPSWRDLVITELAEDSTARHAFITAAGLHGVMLALSVAGGAAGERTLPLMVADGDWDALGDRLVALVSELEDQQLVQLMLALGGLHDAPIAPLQEAEIRHLITYLLDAEARRWDREHRVLPGALLEPWYALRGWAADAVQPPSLVATWAALHPGSVGEQVLDQASLAAIEEWLAIARLLQGADPERLAQLGFFEHDRRRLGDVVDAVRRSSQGAEPIALRILEHVRAFTHGQIWVDVNVLADELTKESGDDRWWAPEDLLAPPSEELRAEAFARSDVNRILADL